MFFVDCCLYVLFVDAVVRRSSFVAYGLLSQLLLFVVSGILSVGCCMLFACVVCWCCLLLVVCCFRVCFFVFCLLVCLVCVVLI